MKRRWLEEALALSGLDDPALLPRDLQREISLALPVTIVSEAALSAFRVRSWLERVGVRHEVADQDRSLHGCLTARAGVGVIFIDDDDPADEKRFTLAHEVAHFVLDHVLPRERAMSVFGDAIRPVLDGVRPPTKEEALYSVLNRAQLGLQVHLMNRGAQGGISAWPVEESEQKADRLALEIIAPARLVLERTRKYAPSPSSVELTQAVQAIVGDFGVPEAAAAAYAELLLGKPRRRRSVLDLIGKP